ncbi:hypothetical protein KOR34_20420 [Posidoniimonas corsicana]|uniref:DUF4139 domain-containing protein n=2 Tax=Posidoniimonas corsicana TaxID=1938618 RepID=A0A5C5VH92_9BACT|nr:hypothetical protein KOR34_20420 [Posidoniimonas corsicana]
MKRVVAFNSGVAFFEYAGTVTGDQTMTLSFDARDINDVLKSLVLLDLDGGHASAVTYDNREPIARSLEALSVDLRANAGLADLLRQLRGHIIQLADEKQTRGRIVSVERRRVPGGDEPLEQDVLLLSVKGVLRTYAVEGLPGLRLADEQLNADFQRALELLAMRSSSETKQVTIDFRGEGERRVRVGLIQEFPVWKTSYRLVLDDDDKPLLQGWAMVENTSNAKWEGVDLALVSGRPISFQMDLYEPLYVRRPMVKAEQFAGLVPRVHQGAFDSDPFADADADPFDARQLDMPARQRGGGGFGGGGFGGGGGAFGGSAGVNLPEERDLSRGMQSSQQTAAVGGEVGELFRYQIATPVTLDPEHSTMLPIVNSQVQGERLSIYNAAVHSVHPLRGLRLTNSTDLHLAAGPITVFDGGEYAGDARLGDVPAGEQRLLSYAVDQECEVTTRQLDAVQTLVDARIVGGAIVLKHRTARDHVYAVKNAADKPRTVLIEHPVDPLWEVTMPAKAAETTRDWRRFELSVPAGETDTLRVGERSVSEHSVALSSINDRLLATLLADDAVGHEVKQTLREFAQRRRELAAAQAALAATTGRLTNIALEHNRIRKNMQTLDKTSQLYRRYEEKLGAQETEIERLQTTSREQQSRINELKQQPN